MFELTLQRVFEGASPFADEPVLTAGLRLLPPATNTATGCARLVAAYPEWDLSTPDSARDGSVRQAAHVAARWALAALNEVRGLLGAAGLADEPVPSLSSTPTPTAQLCLAYHRVDISRQALALAVHTLRLAQSNPRWSRQITQPALDTLWKLCRAHHPDYQARILMLAAQARGLPVLPAWNARRHWQYGWGARGRAMCESTSYEDGRLGASVTADKAASKAAFRALGAPTPGHVLVQTEAELPDAVRRVGWPCVVKPLDRGGGRGVSAGLTTLSAVQTAFGLARGLRRPTVMVEAFVPGEDHRLMVCGGRLVAAIQRRPARVVGDGHSTVAELVQQLNRHRFAHSLVRSRYTRVVLLDEPALQHLESQGQQAESTPAPGQVVTLRSNANLSSGGECIDLSDRVHPHVRAMAESLACSLGLQVVGLDYITADIGRSWADGGGAFIEMNLSPGLDAMVAAGWDEASAGDCALGSEAGRIPVLLVLVPDSALPGLRLSLQAVPSEPTTGWACDGAAALGGAPLSTDPSGWSAVRALLQHRRLHRALLICGTSQVQALGLPVDRSDCTLLAGPVPSAGGTDHWPEDWTALLQRLSGRLLHEAWELRNAAMLETAARAWLAMTAELPDRQGQQVCLEATMR